MEGKEEDERKWEVAEVQPAVTYILWSIVQEQSRSRSLVSRASSSDVDEMSYFPSAMEKAYPNVPQSVLYNIRQSSQASSNLPSPYAFTNDTLSAVLFFHVAAT